MSVSDIIFLLGLLVACTIRTPYAWLYARRRRRRALRKGLDSMILVFVIFGMFIAPLLYLFTETLSFANYRSPLPAQAPIGALLFCLGLWYLWRSHADLGANWSPTVEQRDAHTLVTEGIYRHVRHPMYTAHFLWGAAQLILLENWLAGPSLLLSFTCLYLNRVDAEESLMRSVFGAEYERYMEQTGRLFPQCLGR